MCNKKGSLSHGINLRESKHFHLQVLPILVWYIVYFIVALKVHIGHLQESSWKIFNSFKMLLIFSESSEFFKTSPQTVLYKLPKILKFAKAYSLRKFLFLNRNNTYVVH